MAPTPIGILFKSAATRGGTVEDISIHDVDMQDVKTAFSVNFNWNPSYSYAKIPEGLSNVPAYYNVLAQQVPRAQGLPHLRNVRIANINASGSEQAFSVEAYAEAPVRGVTFRDIAIEAQRAGTIQNAEDWTFENAQIQTADQSRVTLKDSRNVAGVP